MVCHCLTMTKSHCWHSVWNHSCKSWLVTKFGQNCQNYVLLIIQCIYIFANRGLLWLQYTQLHKSPSAGLSNTGKTHPNIYDISRAPNEKLCKLNTAFCPHRHLALWRIHYYNRAYYHILSVHCVMVDKHLLYDKFVMLGNGLSKLDSDKCSNSTEQIKIDEAS